MRDLRNRVAVVTGAGSGIGRALANQLRIEGCALALSDIDEESLSETAAQIPPGDGRVSVHTLDVADRGAVHDYADNVVRAFGGVHLVINNAGVAHADMVSHMTYDDLEWVMNINFWGVVHGTKAFLPTLRDQNYGHIVNMSSVFGLVGIPSQSAYCASKFAVRGFTESLRQELYGTGVRVSSVHPGGVKTNIIRNGRLRRTPLGETGEDRAQLEAAFKLSPSEAAQIIVRGIKRGQRRIIVGADASMLDWVQRLWPEGYTELIRRAIESGRF